MSGKEENSEEINEVHTSSVIRTTKKSSSAYTQIGERHQSLVKVHEAQLTMDINKARLFEVDFSNKDLVCCRSCIRKDT